MRAGMPTVFTARFMLEANTFVPTVCRLNDFDIHTGQDALEYMQLGSVFEDAGFKVIPSVYARSNASGIMEKTAFDWIENRILADLKAHIHEIDGIYMHLHGASEVEGIGSGDHHILKKIREITGPYMPIAVSCDPHGNLCKKYVESCTIIRSYRESPHTDVVQTIQRVCRMLINQILHRTNPVPVYRKLPLILGGEQSVSSDEPVRSINEFMDQMERDPRIMSASWHVGYIRHDTDVAGAGIVVIPSDQKHQAYAEKKADELAEFVWRRRHEFHYTGLTLEPDQALQRALDYSGAPVFITDSGDNVTSRARGANTFVLRQFLAVGNLQKKILFASIADERACHELCSHEPGDEVVLSLGAGFDELSAPVHLTVKLLQKGRMEGSYFIGEKGDYGACATVRVKGTPIDIIVAENNHSFAERHNTTAAGADWMDYDIVICKLGYAFPELLRDGKLCIMSLTDGTTVQDITKIPFKRIMRPMYPIDNI
jgi:microcystin degradation protein MlrC